MSGRSPKTWKLAWDEQRELCRAILAEPKASYSELARRFEIDPTSVRYHAARLGVPPRRPRMGSEPAEFAAYLIADGLSQTQVASDMGVARATLRRALRRLKK